TVGARGASARGGKRAPGPRGGAAPDHVAHHLQRKWAAGRAWRPHLPGILVLVRDRARLPIGPRQNGGPRWPVWKGRLRSSPVVPAGSGWPLAAVSPTAGSRWPSATPTAPTRPRRSPPPTRAPRSTTAT